jgi:hypothetical protein
MAATALTDHCNRKENACKKEESIYGLAAQTGGLFGCLIFGRGVIHRYGDCRYGGLRRAENYYLSEN